MYVCALVYHRLNILNPWWWGPETRWARHCFETFVLVRAIDTTKRRQTDDVSGISCELSVVALKMYSICILFMPWVSFAHVINRDVERLAHTSHSTSKTPRKERVMRLPRHRSSRVVRRYFCIISDISSDVDHYGGEVQGMWVI